MSMGSTCQYNLSKSLSDISTQLIYNSQQEPIIVPNVQELLSIRSDLEAALPVLKKRVNDLQKDLEDLDNNPISQENYNHAIDNTPIKSEPVDELIIPKEQTNNNNGSKKTEKVQEQLNPTSKLDDFPLVKKRPETQGKTTPSNNNQTKRKKEMVVEEELDFIRIKAKDQVPLNTFWTAIEPYFRPLTEQDRKFLLEKPDTGKFFLIPPLGEHYQEKWKREDKLLQINHNEQSLPKPRPNPESLVDRLLSSLISEDLLDDPLELSDDEEETEQFDKSIEIMDFEERLKRELQYSGLFKNDDGDDEDWNAKEDDEICAELRALGREYKDQVKINQDRKKKLLEIVDQQLQFEQYRQVLDTLDKQVEQGYIKRFRNQKSKKSASKSGRSALSENAAYAANKRKTWTNALGEIFKDKNLTMPSKTIYSPPTDGC